MKKVKWTEDWGICVPLCPYCNEYAYEKDHCVFCLKRYEWVESEIKPTVIEHNGFTIVQATDNHIQVYQEGRLIYHASCDKKMSEEELKNQLAFIETIRNKSSSS